MFRNYEKYFLLLGVISLFSAGISTSSVFAEEPITGEIIMLKDVFGSNDENVVADILIGPQVFDYHSVHIAVIKDGIDDNRAFSLGTDFFLPDGNMRLEGQISTQFQGPGSYEFVLSVVELTPGFPRTFLDSAEFEIIDGVVPVTFDEDTTISDFTTIANGEIWIVNEGVTLTINANIENYGEIINLGTIDNTGDINGYVGSLIENRGSIIQTGDIRSSGIVNNYDGSTYTIFDNVDVEAGGTMNNFAGSHVIINDQIKNDGIINNFVGAIITINPNNDGLWNLDGTVNNHGTIINNHHFQNYRSTSVLHNYCGSTFENNGIVDNFGEITGLSIIENGIVNHEAGSIFADECIIAPKFIDSDVTGNQNVGPGEILTVKNGATVDGKITVDGGILILEENCTINGNIKSTNDGTVTINDCAVNGKVTVNTGFLGIQNDSEVTGNVNAKNTVSVFISNNLNSFGKNIYVDNGGHVNIDRNNVAETIRVKNTVFVELVENIVGKHLLSLDNQDTEITDNQVTGNLDTKGTDYVYLEDNVVGGFIKAKGSQFVLIEGNSSGKNLEVKDSTEVEVSVNQIGKNLRVFTSNHVQIYDNHASNNINIKDNTDCSGSGNTADGKIKVKDCPLI